MIRILHVVYKMDRGGIQSFIMNVYRNINRDKVQFDFLVTKDKEPGYFDEEIRSLGGRIYQVTRRNQGLIKSIKETNRFFREHPEYKVIHAHMSSLSNVSFLKIAKKYGVINRIVHSHNTRQGGSSLHKYIHKFNQIFLKSYATEYFACSDLAAKWMYPKKVYEDNEVKVINNAIETEKFKQSNVSRPRLRTGCRERGRPENNRGWHPRETQIVGRHHVVPAGYG